MSVQPIDPKKPDLEESINVAQQHAAVSRSVSAASREQQLRENGLEPVSVWLFIAGSIIAIIAGSVLFKSNNILGYDEFVKSGYIQAEDNNVPPPVPQGAVEVIYMAKGKELYSGSCAGCHAADGNGASCPPLAGSSWVVDSPYVPAMILKHGVHEKLVVKGKDWSATMPAVGGSFNDMEMASVIYYIQNSFGNKVGNLYTLEQISQINKDNDGRTAVGPSTAPELRSLKKKQVTGDFFPAGTVINKKTGEIIEAK